MPKVLITDKMSALALETFQARGIEADYEPGLSAEDLEARVDAYDGLAVRSATQVTAELLEAAANLKVVGRAGIGVDNIDVAAATARGIVVVNTPEGNNITTAEHAITLLLSLARHVPRATASMKAGKWEKKKFQGMELYNRTLGVLGAGNIGRFVVSRAKGLGMKVIVHDPYLTAEAAARLEVERVELDEMMSRADIVTVHVPKTKETTGILGRKEFAKAKPGLIVINAARGGIVDEEALLEALDSGQVAAAGLDVFVEEPPAKGHPLVNHPSVICTPHLGASTEQAQINVAIAVCEQVRDYLVDGVVGAALNMPSVPKEVYEQLRPYLQLGEKRGRFHGQLSSGSIEQIEIEFSGDAASLDVAPITVAVLKGMLESVSDQVNMVNAPVIAQQRGIKVIESKTSFSQDFASAIATRVVGCVDRYIVGAIFHGGQPRIVRIDDFMLEAIPEGSTLFIQNHDQPGVVGTVGTVLGEGGINISRMQLGLVPERGVAAMLVNIDRRPERDVMERLRGLPHMISAQLVELGK